MTTNQNDKKQYDNTPKIESFVQRRRTDKGDFVIHKTVITDIRSVRYYEAVLKDEEVVA